MSQGHLYFGPDIHQEPHVIATEKLAQAAVQHIPGASILVKQHFSKQHTFRELRPQPVQNALMYEAYPAH